VTPGAIINEGRKLMTSRSSRRSFLRFSVGVAGAAASWPLFRALADPPRGSDEFFVFLHAAGGWDVTLWADPRNERKGLVEPASTANTDTGPLHHWQDAPLDGEVRTFKLLQPPGARLAFGPGIGSLIDLHDRLCVVNGLAMNTVSHPDGTAFSATGRHLQGGRVPQASVNTILAHEFGVAQKFPSISVQFPSSWVPDAGGGLDRRAAPLIVDRIGNIGSTLARPSLYDSADDRAAVSALLSHEAAALAAKSTYPDALSGISLQYGGLEKMVGGELQEVFNDNKLRAARPEFNYKARFHGAGAVNAAFAVEAMRRNLVRCVSFSLGGFDTHGANYRQQAQVQEELFDLVAALVKVLDATPHPTLPSEKLGAHAHLLVFSDFCRTPQVNLAGGRDHYPNNSALVISPRFRGGFCFGRSDLEQLLPAGAKAFADGERPIAPPDLLATFLSAFGVVPGRYLRDGEVVRELLPA
jgi:uncharacterized protein DUF1501